MVDIGNIAEFTVEMTFKIILNCATRLARGSCFCVGDPQHTDSRQPAYGSSHHDDCVGHCYSLWRLHNPNVAVAADQVCPYVSGKKDYFCEVHAP